MSAGGARTAGPVVVLPRPATPWLPTAPAPGRVLVTAGAVGLVMALTLSGTISGAGWTLVGLERLPADAAPTQGQRTSF